MESQGVAKKKKKSNVIETLTEAEVTKLKMNAAT